MCSNYTVNTKTKKESNIEEREVMRMFVNKHMRKNAELESKCSKGLSTKLGALNPNPISDTEDYKGTR